MTISKDTVRRGIRHLRRADPVMKTLIRQVGTFELKLNRNRFAALARAIVAQQISGAAARTIWKRLETHLAPATTSPTAIAQCHPEQLRALGLSRQKTAYLLDLARKSVEGTIPWQRFSRMNDDEIIKSLIEVKGIGRWTAQMFLIFSLGRPDVFAPDDLGLRSAIRNLYGLPHLPGIAESLRVAAPWRPYSSIASWYLWRSLDN